MQNGARTMAYNYGLTAIAAAEAATIQGPVAFVAHIFPNTMIPIYDANEVGAVGARSISFAINIDCSILVAQTPGYFDNTFVPNLLTLNQVFGNVFDVAQRAAFNHFFLVNSISEWSGFPVESLTVYAPPPPGIGGKRDNLGDQQACATPVDIMNTVVKDSPNGMVNPVLLSCG
ncbi:hypothetical protein G7Y89_g14745 [Cudoniella acicularis]|uniref:Uncharacterized protein n=1 Tax=Cudoniella acicularis TaxID=354080 RepID=A0A8H4QZG7_9HELO|nr:hypothetical protein G7Y89_g14745 [Cudoniella acicularis]